MTKEELSIYKYVNEIENETAITKNILIDLWNASKNISDFEEKVFYSSNPKVFKSRIYALISRTSPNVWYNIRKMFGDKCFKLRSYNNVIRVGDDKVSFFMKFSSKDKISLVAVFDDLSEFNLYLMDLKNDIDGEFHIYSYDDKEENEIAKTLNGHYCIYSYNEFIAFVKTDLIF